MNTNEDWDDEELEDVEGEQQDTLHIMHELEVTKGQESMRIDKYLMIRIEGATRNKIQKNIDDNYVLVNNEPVKANYKVRPFDKITIYDHRTPEQTEVVPENIPLNIVYEDDQLMIVNKPAGMVIHPGCGNYSGTLVNGLAYYLQDHDGGIPSLPRVGLVHRIDKDTSGIVVIAKTPEAMVDLSKQFEDHTVHRRYIALVWGNFEEEEGTINLHVGRHQRFRKIMATYPDGFLGKEAITHYKILKRYNYVSLLELRLETGRTHQIRVHMQSKGHPLFNDATYGGNRIVKGTVFTKYKQFVENCFRIIPRHALHAKELGFIHPSTKEYMQFNSELPEDMLQAIERWDTYVKGMTSQLKNQLNGE